MLKFIKIFTQKNNNFAYKVVYRAENAAYEFVKTILKEFEYCKKVMKKYFKKN